MPVRSAGCDVELIKAAAAAAATAATLKSTHTSFPALHGIRFFFSALPGPALWLHRIGTTGLDQRILFMEIAVPVALQTWICVLARTGLGERDLQHISSCDNRFRPYGEASANIASASKNTVSPVTDVMLMSAFFASLVGEDSNVITAGNSCGYKTYA